MARVQAVAEEIYLADQLDTEAGLLSHGQKQWLEIGMLLMQEPELLMLDEPVAGMSARERELTADLLKRICKNRCVIVIEHDMEFVKQIAHKVTVMHQGKILAEGPMDEGAGRPEGDRRLPRPLNARDADTDAAKSTGSAYVGLRPERSHLHGISFDGRARTRPSPSWAATAWARPRCSRALIGMLPMQAAAASSVDGAGRHAATRASGASPRASPTCRRAA